MTKHRQAIILGVLTMIATTVIFSIMPKPVMYGKMYIQFSFVILAELICICGYVMLPDQKKHLKTTIFILFLLTVVFFNAILANTMDLRGMIGTNLMILIALAVVFLITHKWLKD